MSEPALDRLANDIKAFLDEASAQGKYEDFDGLVTGWTLFVDRLVPEDAESDGDDGWRWTALKAPGQSPSLTIGHGIAITRAFGLEEAD